MKPTYRVVLAILWTIFTTSGNAYATVFLLSDFENKSANSSIADGERLDGAMWDNYGIAPPVRSAIPTPSGANYLEWHCPASTTDALTEIYFGYPSTTPITMGTTYYLAAFCRFQRVNNRDIWRDTQTGGDGAYQFDKLFEFRGSGFRWGIGSGWNGGYLGNFDHKFTFDAWYATSVLGDHGPDHIVADQAPYGIRNPYLCDYDRWYGVVLGVTANSSNAGRVQLWIDGTKIIDQAHYTANLGATLDRVGTNGTIAQPAYDSPEHYRQVDRIILTDNWQDIVNGGYVVRISEPGTLALLTCSGVVVSGRMLFRRRHNGLTRGHH